MSSFFERLTGLIIRRRGFVIAIILLLTTFFLWQMQHLKFDNSNEIWFSEGDPSLARINMFKEIFGNDEFVYLVFDADSLFSPDAQETLSNLVAELRKEVPYLRDITWIGNAEYIESDAEGIVISDFLEKEEHKSLPPSALKDKALAENSYRDNLISADGKTAGIILELLAYPSNIENTRVAVTKAVRKVLELPEYASFAMHVVGQPILSSDYHELSFKESATFFGLCLLVQMVLLFWFCKGIRGMLAPLVVVVLSVIWTLGLIQLLGFTLNLFIIIIPTLLICVCIGDSMYIIATYNQYKKQGTFVHEALQKAVSDTGLACLLTSITTAVGFLSFYAADLQPFREMGIYASICAIFAYILSVIIVIIIFSFYSNKMSTPTYEAVKKDDMFDALLRGVYKINIKYPKQLLIIFMLLLGASAYGYTFLEVETNTARMLSKSIPLRQSYDFVDERMGGTMSVEIMLDTGKENGIKDPAFLKGMEKLQNALDASSLVTKTVSILDIIKKLNEAMHGGDNNFYALPTEYNTVAQYLLLYEISNGKNLDKVVSFDSSVVRITAKTHILNTSDVRKLLDEVTILAQDIFGDKVAVNMAGSLDWTRSMNDLLAQGQQKSFLTALIVISIIMCFILGSFQLGLISMLPNVFPVFMTLGLMGAVGIYMDMALMSFSAIIIGVVVDDTIHFLFHYRKFFKLTGSYEKALENTLLSTGRALLFTTITLVCGFAVLLFSDMTGVSKFGGLACFAFIWALIADFFLVPAILLTFRPLKLLSQKRGKEHE